MAGPATGKMTFFHHSYKCELFDKNFGKFLKLIMFEIREI